MNGLIVLILAAGSIGDAPPASANAPTVVVTQPDESKFPEITVYYELKRPDGSFVLDARRDEFRVTEDGRERPILGFEAPVSTEARPMTLVLVVDRSGSMERDDRIGSLKKAVAAFLEGMPKGSRVAVLSFSNDIELICPFTTNYAKAIEAVDALELGDGTRYFDAVARGLELLGEETGRRAVLALTDGEDNASRRYSLARVIARAKALGLPVHTLGFGDEREIAVDALVRLAAETRGQHYLARDADQLRKIYEEIARRIGNSYSLTYQTDRKIPDGTLRPIRIAYQKGALSQAGETAFFVRGMVVPQAGWSALFLGLLGFLIILARLPDLATRVKTKN